MKKHLILIAITLMIVQSCDAQSFDLANLKFPFKKAAIDKFKPKQAPAGEMSFLLLTVESPDALYFNKAKLSGSTGGEHDYIGGKNLVNFYSDSKTGDIYGYKLNTFTTPESEKLLSALTAKFGKPSMDRGSSNRARVWESAGNQVLYLLEYGLFSINNAPKTESARLIVIDKSAQSLYKYNFTGAFQYYGDYVEARSNKKGKYTYADFLKEMKAKGSMSYLKGDNTVK